MTAPVHLGRKLVLETPVRLEDGAGGHTETWTALGTVWADVQNRTGRERAALAATLSEVHMRIIVRAAPVGAPSRPQPGQRFTEGARRFFIRAVSELDRSGLYLTCFADEEIPA